jgi:hypothetical protein
MESLIGLLGFIVAAWQLHLQRREIRRNGKITALVHMSVLIKERIDFYSSIIESLKAQGKSWQGHARVINDELRPLLAKIHKDLLDTTSGDAQSFDCTDIMKALRLQAQNESADGDSGKTPACPPVSGTFTRSNSSAISGSAGG